jgi:hypothetical protein
VSRNARRLAGVGVATTGALFAVFLGTSDVSFAQSPTVAAWWSASNAGDPAPPPPQPGVHQGELLVQGSNAVAQGTPIGPAPASSQAVAGLAFDLQPTDLVGALSLTIDGSPPQQVSVTACRATATFTTSYGGPWSQVPPYDNTACVPGALKGNVVTFKGVNALVRNDSLAVVLLPGPLDRVVFAKPTEQTLVVQHGGSVGISAPAFGSGTDQGGFGPPPGAVVPPVAPLSGAPISAPRGPLPPNPAGTGANPPPVVAGPQQQPTRQVALAGDGLSRTTRRVIALSVIALEVAGFLLLARAPGQATGARATATERGVGRFRRARTGPAPQV